MQRYLVTYDDTQRRSWAVMAEGREEALELFWLAHNKGELDDWQTGSSEPQNISVTERR